LDLKDTKKHKGPAFEQQTPWRVIGILQRCLLYTIPNENLPFCDVNGDDDEVRYSFLRSFFAFCSDAKVNLF